MTATSAEELTRKKCVPCEGGIPPLTGPEIEALLKTLPDWKKSASGPSIRREWRARSFVAAIDFFNKVAQLAEAEGHHPDLHLTGYYDVLIEIRTHAIGGLTENDFILAAKIDALPFAKKKN